LNVFLPRDAMHSAEYVVARCLSVRPSHAGIVSIIIKRSSSNFFHRRVADTIPVFSIKRYGAVPRGTP